MIIQEHYVTVDNNDIDLKARYKYNQTRQKN